MAFFIEEQELVLNKLHGKDKDYEDNIEFLKSSLENFL